MAFPASNWYRTTLQALVQRATAGPDIDTDAWKVALYTTSIGATNFDTDSDRTAAPYATNEASGTGYTAGGNAITLTTSKGTTAGGTPLLINAGGTSQWTTASFSAEGAIIYDTTNATKWLLAAYSFGSTQTVTAGTFTINWNNGTPFTVVTFT